MSVHVAVLSGGLSLEREVSLRSGERVAHALTETGHRVTRLDVGADLVSRLAESDVEVAFLALHGQVGEDGTIQSLLDLLGLPYTGPDRLASALAWNKPIAQGLYRRAGLTTPDHITLSQRAFREMGAAAAMSRVADALGLPLIVKPGTGGSSLGLSHVTDPAGLPQAMVAALSHADTCLVERCISGTEVAVGVLGGEPLPVVEIQPKEGTYDFAARYTAGATEFHVPARLEEETLARCAEAALTAYRAVGARHITRADMVVDAQGTPWLLELDTCPGLTDTSLLPLAAQGAGLSFRALCQRILDLALTDTDG